MDPMAYTFAEFVAYGVFPLIIAIAAKFADCKGVDMSRYVNGERASGFMCALALLALPFVFVFRVLGYMLSLDNHQ